jgi:hypothetical protein
LRDGPFFIYRCLHPRAWADGQEVEMYNARDNRIECPFCLAPMRPFGGRLTPGFADVPEVFLCVECGYSVDLRLAVAEALIQQAVVRRRAENAQRYVGVAPNGTNGRHGPLRRLRGRVVRSLIKMLDEGHGNGRL